MTDLARFKTLFVLSTGSTAKHQQQSADHQRLKQELGVNYLLNGSVHREMASIKLSTSPDRCGVWQDHLVGNLRRISPSHPVSSRLQNDVSRQVSAIIAINYGMMAQTDLTEAQRRPPKSFDAYDCVLRYYHYQRSFDPQEPCQGARLPEARRRARSRLCGRVGCFCKHLRAGTSVWLRSATGALRFSGAFPKRSVSRGRDRTEEPDRPADARERAVRSAQSRGLQLGQEPVRIGNVLEAHHQASRFDKRTRYCPGGRPAPTSSACFP